ncbi:hypothetical protein EXIGLDRAFT_728431 [Exidia glandulosa HHB12029]|uniref:Uncharacterized protein n=1 Tax=Exidia glandulosa HHB12029 TaxID=1314781 RepID=A0A165CXM8_EXIGL|nr:hypothetical protein EXIGLDRAFT_728431 [Exidia glandulosa HHB12029]
METCTKFSLLLGATLVAVTTHLRGSGHASRSSLLATPSPMPSQFPPPLYTQHAQLVQNYAAPIGLAPYSLVPTATFAYIKFIAACLGSYLTRIVNLARQFRATADPETLFTCIFVVVLLAARPDFRYAVRTAYGNIATCIRPALRRATALVAAEVHFTWRVLLFDIGYISHMDYIPSTAVDNTLEEEPVIVSLRSQYSDLIVSAVDGPDSPFLRTGPLSPLPGNELVLDDVQELYRSLPPAEASLAGVSSPLSSNAIPLVPPGALDPVSGNGPDASSGLLNASGSGDGPARGTTINSYLTAATATTIHPHGVPLADNDLADSHYPPTISPSLAPNALAMNPSGIYYSDSRPLNPLVSQQYLYSYEPAQTLPIPYQPSQPLSQLPGTVYGVPSPQGNYGIYQAYSPGPSSFYPYYGSYTLPVPQAPVSAASGPYSYDSHLRVPVASDALPQPQMTLHGEPSQASQTQEGVHSELASPSQGPDGEYGDDC